MAGMPLPKEVEALLPLDLPEDFFFPKSGGLPAQWIKKLFEREQIWGRPLDASQIQPASLDLRLGKTAYKIHASFLPGRGISVQDRIERLKSYEIDLSTPQVLARGSVYIVEIEETLHLSSTISAIANPKSSTG